MKDTIIRDGITYVEGNTRVSDKAIVTAYHPILTEEQRAERIRNIEHSLRRFYHACVELGVPWPGSDDPETQEPDAMP